jgi:hypothetical protein
LTDRYRILSEKKSAAMGQTVTERGSTVETDRREN